MDFKRGIGVVAQARLVYFECLFIFSVATGMIWNDFIYWNDYSSVQYNVRRDELASFSK